MGVHAILRDGVDDAEGPSVHAVLPDGVDDPARPSGGNVYDRRVCSGLAAEGWVVHEHGVPGFWTVPDADSFAGLASTLARIPDDGVVLLDGLIGSAAPEVLLPQARRLRLIVLVHMPLGHRPANGDAGRVREREGAVLSASAAVVTTSAWTRRRLLELYELSPERVHVAEPAVERAQLASASAGGGALLCVAAVSFDKGHDVLLDALAAISDLSWHCTCVGSLDRDPAFAARLRQRSDTAGLGNRIEFPGPRTGADLDRSYDAADLLVLPSRAETYGMVLTEALARGLPVVAANAGGVTEALGYAADATTRPGLLVAPDDPPALARALRAWLGDADLRRRLRRAARERRDSLSRWDTTTSAIAGVLAGASR
jgi:glycosyltransferase involved in cell wall biosynthesis